MAKKALIVTRVSGFVPQFEMSHVQILQQMGYEVHYAANFHTIVYGKDNSRLKGTGIIKHQIDFQRSPFSPSVLRSCRQLNALLKKEQFDLIHCHMPMSGVVTRVCAAKMMKKGACKKAPVLYTAHGFHFSVSSPLKNWLYYPVERFLARYTDRLITINEEDYERACHFPVRGKVEKIAGAGIDLTPYPMCRVSEEEAPELEKKLEEKRKKKRAELGIKDDEFVLISVGELTTRKNHRLALQAIKESEYIKKLRYILCGSGPLEEELKALAAVYNIQDKVIFAGYCQNVQDFLLAADCFIFPSLQEGLPMAVMEAMATGLPVLCLPIRGNIDLIDNVKGGYLLEPKSMDIGIMLAIDSKEERKVFRKEWNRKKVQNFSKEVVDEQMRKIYQEVTLANPSKEVQDPE